MLPLALVIISSPSCFLAGCTQSHLIKKQEASVPESHQTLLLVSKKHPKGWLYYVAVGDREMFENITKHSPGMDESQLLCAVAKLRGTAKTILWRFIFGTKFEVPPIPIRERIVQNMRQLGFSVQELPSIIE